MDVQFNEPEYTSAVPAVPKKARSSLSDLVIRSGFAKNEKGVQIIFLIVLVSSVILIGFSMLGMFAEPPVEPPSESF